jgi:hypothetical protein
MKPPEIVPAVKSLRFLNCKMFNFMKLFERPF